MGLGDETRFSDGSVGVVHSAVCGSSKFTGIKTCFEKMGVALQRPTTRALRSSNPEILQGWHSLSLQQDLNNGRGSIQACK